jgi:hypothetical protein
MKQFASLLLIEKSSVAYTTVAEPAAERTTNEEAEIIPELQINDTTDSNIEVSVVTLRSRAADLALNRHALAPLRCLTMGEKRTLPSRALVLITAVNR